MLHHFLGISSRSSERFGLLSRRAIGSIRGASPFRSTTGDWVINITSSPQNCAGRGGTGIAFHFHGALVIKPARSACTREESEGYRHAPPFRVGGLAALGNCLPSSIRWVRLPSGAPFCRRCGKQTHIGSGRRARHPWPLASRCSARSDKPLSRHGRAAIAARCRRAGQTADGGASPSAWTMGM
jgi:hypothetical protein